MTDAQQLLVVTGASMPIFDNPLVPAGKAALVDTAATIADRNLVLRVRRATFPSCSDLGMMWGDAFRATYPPAGKVIVSPGSGDVVQADECLQVVGIKREYLVEMLTCLVQVPTVEIDASRQVGGLGVGGMF